MEEFRIDLENEAFYPGQEVIGQIYVRNNESIKADNIVVSISGKAVTSWSENENKVDDSCERSVEYYNAFIYVNQSKNVWEVPSDNLLPAGEHQFPFSFKLPPQLPPNFKSQYGKIYYKINAKIDRSWHVDNTEEKLFTVLPYVDLNLIPAACHPIVQRMDKDLGVLFYKHGNVDVTISIPKSGHVCGEPIHVRVNINNQSTRDIEKIKLELNQDIIFRAQREGRRNVYDKYQKTEIATHTDRVNISQGSLCVYEHSLMVPSNLIVSTDTMCPIIQVFYWLTVTIVAQGHVGNKLEAKIPIIIGTVPVESSQNPNNFDVTSLIQPSLKKDSIQLQIKSAEIQPSIKGALTQPSIMNALLQPLITSALIHPSIKKPSIDSKDQYNTPNIYPSEALQNKNKNDSSTPYPHSNFYPVLPSAPPAYDDSQTEHENTQLELKNED